MADLASRLTRARTRVESLLFGTDGTPLGTVRVTRLVGVADDAALDVVTGEVAEPTSDLVYDGPGVIRPVSRMQPNGGALDGQQPLPARDPHYEVLLPLAVPNFQTGDLLIAVTSAIDPQLVGRTFIVAEDLPVSAIGVVRTVPLEATT